MTVPSFQMTIKTQYLKDFSVENPKAPHIFSALKAQPQVTIQGDVLAQALDAEHHEVALRLTLQMMDEAAQPICIMDTLYAGVFHFTPALNDPEHPILFIEAPRYLFPFARQILVDATLHCGFPPVFIQPIDFAALYHQRQEQSRQTKAAS